MKILVITVAVALTLGACASAPEPRADDSTGAVREQDGSPAALARDLEYLHHLWVAERHLDDGRPSSAAEHAARAIELAVPNWIFRGFGEPGRSPTAHYVRARALARLGRTAEALASLELAAANGFTDIDRLEVEPDLAALRELERFEDVIDMMPDGDPTDVYAGRTVRDREFGNGLITRRKNNFPKLGEQAPDFELETRQGEGTFRLSSLRGTKPVVLVFGSFT